MKVFSTSARSTPFRMYFKTDGTESVAATATDATAAQDATSELVLTSPETNYCTKKLGDIKTFNL